MGSSKHSERDMDVPLLKFEGEDKNEKSSKINFRLNIITISLAVFSIILSVITILS